MQRLSPSDQLLVWHAQLGQLPAKCVKQQRHRKASTVGCSVLCCGVTALLLPPLRHEPVSGPAVEAVEKDNRDLVDLNTSQALTTEDIEAMKANGKVR